MYMADQETILLKDYIKSVLQQISEAINECNSEHIYSKHMLVNPTLKNAELSDGENWYVVNPKDKTRSRIENVEFETALTASKSNGIDGGVSIMALKLGGTKHSDYDNANKVRFTIPVVFPSSDTDD